MHVGTTWCPQEGKKKRAEAREGSLEIQRTSGCDGAFSMALLLLLLLLMLMLRLPVHCMGHCISCCFGGWGLGADGEAWAGWCGEQLGDRRPTSAGSL